MQTQMYTQATKARMKILLSLLLALGLVLASGCSGSGGGGPSEPGSPGWTELAPMSKGLGESAAAYWDGKIYVAGGFDTSRLVQIYDVASDRWEVGPALPRGTDNAGAVASDGKVYVVGGEGGALFIYDVAAAQWSTGASLPRPKFSSVVELIGGELHMVGGWSHNRQNNVSLDHHDAYDLAAGTYRQRAAAPTARNHALSGVIDGKLYVTGGRAPGHEGEDAQNVTATEVYDPTTDQWSTKAPLPTPRSGGASAVLDGKLYVMGGGLPGDEISAVVERYDPATDQWERLGDLPAAITGQRAVAINGSLYVLGGFAVKDGKRAGYAGQSKLFRYTP